MGWAPLILLGLSYLRGRCSSAMERMISLPRPAETPHLHESTYPYLSFSTYAPLPFRNLDITDFWVDWTVVSRLVKCRKGRYSLLAFGSWLWNVS